MKVNSLLVVFFIFITVAFVERQHKTRPTLGFYNLENLFDTLNDPHTNDNEFLPNKKKQWDSTKYHRKLLNLSRAIMSMNNWSGPDVLGVCEVENESVLYDLIHKTVLKHHGYDFVHRDSKDKRGIDVALLYKKSSFKPGIVRVIEVDVSLDTNRQYFSRDIMVVDGELHGVGDIKIFVNHWPSRRGGQEKSAPKRMIASQLLTHAVKAAAIDNIVVMGDFNDESTDASLANFIEKTQCQAIIQPRDGTLKYQSKWSRFDQILVSPNLLPSLDTWEVYRHEWLLMHDDNYGGDKPFRTYLGTQYLGGYSDHLPVSITLKASH